jgi:cytochrome bd-type quinol oxidase subunit 2
MSEAVRQNRLGCMSSIALIAGWVLFWAFISSGMKYHAENSWIRVVTMAILLFAPVAAVLAIAGLVFDAKKKVSLVSLLISLLSVLLIFSIGG